MKKWMLLALTAIMTLGLSAQNYGEIHGKAIFEDGTPASFANVWVDVAGVKKGAMADIDGKYRIKPLMAGEYTVFISYLGHTVEVRGVRVIPDEIAFATTATLGDKVNAIGDAEVIYYTDPLINKDGATKMTIRAADIQHSPMAKDIVGLALSMSSDIKKDPNGEGLYFRGARSGDTQYLVDGVKVYGRAPRIPSSGISSMSVYTGGVPAKYGDCIGGYVIIETKSFTDIYNRRKAEDLKKASQRATE